MPARSDAPPSVTSQTFAVGGMARIIPDEIPNFFTLKTIRAVSDGRSTAMTTESPAFFPMMTSTSEGLDGARSLIDTRRSPTHTESVSRGITLANAMYDDFLTTVPERLFTK